MCVYPDKKTNKNTAKILIVDVHHLLTPSIVTKTKERYNHSKNSVERTYEKRKNCSKCLSITLEDVN